MRQRLSRRAKETAPLIALFVLSLTLAAALTSPQAAPVTAVPGVICIDAGHGGFDPGARGSNTNAVEAELNLAVARYLRDELVQRGFKVIMTRSDDGALGDDKAADMAARKRILNADGVVLAVSIHMNRFTDPSVSGPMVFYQSGSADGETLAKLTVDAVCDALGRPRRIANPGDYFVLRECAAVAVLVECGFLSNAADEALLVTDAHHRTLASAIASGILTFLSPTFLS